MLESVISIETEITVTSNTFPLPIGSIGNIDKYVTSTVLPPSPCEKNESTLTECVVNFLLLLICYHC